MICSMKNEGRQGQGSANGCCCGNGGGQMDNPLWSTKKKIRFLEDRLKELNAQKSDIQELIEELKER